MAYWRSELVALKTELERRFDVEITDECIRDAIGRMNRERQLCRELPSLPKMANIVEDGDTPALPPARLEELGFRIAAYPLTLLSSAARAMQDALAALAAGEPAPARLSFSELQELVGFPEYDASLRAYGGSEGVD